MKTNEWIAVIIVMIIVSVIVSLITANLVGKSPLLSPTIYQSTEYQILNPNGTLIGKLVASIDGKSFALMNTAGGNIKLVGNVSVQGSLTPTSLSSDRITTKTIKGNGDLILTTGNNGTLRLSPEMKRVVVQGTLTTDNFSVTNLKGTGNAYACIDKNGTIYRNLTACK